MTVRKRNVCPCCGHEFTPEEAKAISLLQARQRGGSRSSLPEGWVSPEKAARALGMSRPALLEKVRTGEVRAYRVFRQGPKRVIYGFRKADLGI